MNNAGDQNLLFIPVLRKSVQELLGEEHTQEIFARAISSGEIKNGRFAILEELGHSFAEKYEEVTARGLMIRTGRASLTFLRRFERRVSVLGAINNRLKPLQERFRFSLSRLASFITSTLDLKVKIQQSGAAAFVWRMRLIGRDKMAMEYTPFYFFGLLQEFCEWLDARKNYRLAFSHKGESEMDVSILIDICDQD